MSRFTGFRRALGVSPRPAPRDALAETKETQAGVGQAGERVTARHGPRSAGTIYTERLRRTRTHSVIGASLRNDLRRFT